jgi:NAD(P)-dependent dehydrogenase (short-subunit alcohol dehydrogenase family)
MDANPNLDPDLNPDLSGRTALVTGSAVRVGRAVLLGLAAAGADVAVHHRDDPEAAAETASEAATHGVETTVVEGDVTDPEAVDALFERCERTLGTVDVLVNAVGPLPQADWDDLSPAEWQATVAANLYGTYLCTRRALPGMREQEWGRVVNFGAADARDDHALPRNLPYFIAKRGVLTFTRSVAYDTQHDGVTVNAVSPYAVENTVTDPSAFPRGRPAAFEDVLAPILFFCSEAAAYLSGQNVAVDGGRLHEA